MKLTIHTIETAPEGSHSTLDGIAGDLGFVPNLAAAVAESPALLAAFDGLRRAVAAADLAPVHREIAGLATGAAVDNAYGVAFHSTVLDRLGLDATDVDAMRDGREPADRTQAAVYALARAIALTRGKVAAEVVERAADEGLSTEAILEIVAECTFAGLVGTIDNLAGGVELDDFLAPRAWTPAATAGR
ncbi:MAG: carboxymuconolactone decarboxylase family protein [Ilumatobacteraceae bacterium]